MNHMLFRSLDSPLFRAILLLFFAQALVACNGADPGGDPDGGTTTSTNKGDICKPADTTGKAEVIVGLGQSNYLAADDYTLAEVEAGPQGGYHIWVAARVKNLHQSGSITKVSGEIPDLGLMISPLQVIFTMDADEGGYCKLYGLRFQIDIDGGPVSEMLGKEMKTTVTVTDIDSEVGVDDLWVKLSDYTI